MSKNTVVLLAGLMLATLADVRGQSVEIVSDNYNVTGSGSGFALGSGVNSGINPPTTRLTGSASGNLRYIKAFGAKADSAHSIATNRLQIARIATDSSTLSLSSGTGAFDFGTALNTLAATPGVPSVYELTINIANAAAAAQRCSFAISSASGTANTWDFGIQLYRVTTSDSFYTLQKRISAGAGTGTLINTTIGTVGTYSNEVAFLIRVTDAGAETSTYSSRIQVSVDSGATWIYDSSTDTTELPNGWRFPAASRFIYWDAAGGSGPVTFDNFSLNFISGPTAGTKTWTGAGADDNWSSGANWDGIAPTTGDTLVFAGTTRPTNINDLTGLTVPSVTFTNGGFELLGNPLTISGAISNLAGNNTFAGEVVWGSTAVKTWSLASGSEVILNNTNTAEVTGDHTIIGGGTLRLKGAWNSITANPAFIVNEGKHIVDGGTFTSRGGYRLASLATGTGAQTILSNGATFALTTSGSNLRVGDSANPNASQLVINNSTLTLAGGALGIPYAAGATGTVTQVGGTVSGGSVAFSDNGAGNGSYTINSGTLETIQIRKDTAGGFSSIHFDNAILRTSSGASSTAFFSGLDVAEIGSGGLTLDATVDVTIAQALSGAGVFVKSNAATVILSGANTYSGNTVVQSGKLVLPTIQTNATTIQVADGAELGVMVRAPGSSLSVSGAALGNISSSTLSFDLATNSNPTAPIMKVVNLSANAPVTINVANGFQLSSGQIVLVDYDGAITGGFNFTLGTLPSGVTATLVNNTANSSIDLNITGVPGFRWTGATSGDWDTISTNWISLQTVSPSTYSDGSPTEFLDGAATGIINVISTPAPAIITVSNNILPYVWSGAAIVTPALQKFGTNSLTRVENGADSIGSLELNEGAVILTNVFDAIFATVLTDVTAGAGTLVKQGAGMLTVFSTNSTYDGAIEVQQGRLQLGGTSALGSTNGTTTIADGATLDVNDQIAPHERVTVAGQGVGGLGAILDSASGTGVAHNLTDVTMVGDTTFGCPNGGRWDIRIRTGSGPGPGLKGNGFNLTKVGSGSVSIACQRHFSVDQPYWEMNLGDVFINEGSLTFAESLSLGNPSKTIAVAPGATLTMFDLGFTNPIARTISMTNATISSSGNPPHTNVLNGSINLSGANYFVANQATLIINGTITGEGSLSMSATSPGKVLLNGINTYTGDMTVNSGVLGGYGVIAGNLVMVGGTNAPGVGVGTLTVNGNATLAGTTLMELDRSQSPNSDRLVAGGTFSWSGDLKVVLGTGAPNPQAGDVYQLFNKAGTGGFATISLPDLSALPGGLAWNTNNLSVNGSISVTGTATPPTIGTVSIDGSSIIFTGTGGAEGGTYTVLSSTNVATPVANWIPISTNLFGPGGSFSSTNAIDTAAPTTFFLLQVP